MSHSNEFRPEGRLIPWRGEKDFTHFGHGKSLALLEHHGNRWFAQDRMWLKLKMI